MGQSQGSRLLKALSEAGITRKELARRLAGPDADVSAIETQRRQISRWAKEDATFHDQTARRLAEALGVPLEALARTRPPLSPPPARDHRAPGAPGGDGGGSDSRSGAGRSVDPSN
jgi:transcriptional regulator with XRE-family HTH domain